MAKWLGSVSQRYEMYIPDLEDGVFDPRLGRTWGSLYFFFQIVLESTISYQILPLQHGTQFVGMFHYIVLSSILWSCVHIPPLIVAGHICAGAAGWLQWKPSNILKILEIAIT